MSKIDSLRQQYPELGISLMDILVRMDNSKTNKYLPLLCKLFSKKYRRNTFSLIDETEIAHQLTDKKGIKLNGLSIEQQYAIYCMLDIIPSDNFTSFKEFQEYMERGLIENKDVLTYSTLEEVQQAISIAVLKESAKDLENQVDKVYEDAEWLIVRPLTFEASSKYGAGTKWCTTQKNDKQYFTRYWSRGVLAYIINKQTGLKYGMFKEKSLYEDGELSFWDAPDNRVDFLMMDIGDQLLPIIKQLIKSDKTNEQLCSNELIETVWEECNPKEWAERKLKKMMHEMSKPIPMDTRTPIEEEIVIREGREFITINTTHDLVPTIPVDHMEESIMVTRRQLTELIDQHINNAIRTRPTPPEPQTAG